jgi:CheY-like chemotaxis protein
VRRVPHPLSVRTGSSFAPDVATSDTRTFVSIDAFTSECSNTFCITFASKLRVSGGRSVAKILVADDNSNIQKMVGLALKDQGIDVVAVGNGEAAVRKISDIRPDLVLADVFMPVRNGYEVCRYVKEDPSLAHIPVILLVGAFDPLDEQEAQRVGADGVLKKPFVPPDPLISMVKSALARAGVAIGNAPAPAEKAPEPAVRSAKENLGSKLAAMSPAAGVPEAEAIPAEFPVPPPSLKIAAGSEPVAFGSLLETPENDMAFVTKPIEEIEAARGWGTSGESDEVEEEEDPESPSRGGWRPGGLDESLEKFGVPAPNASAKDWREEAFHGDSPANGAGRKPWSPVEATRISEVTGAPGVGVSTLESARAASPSPFTGDAWASALATTVQETIVGAGESPVTESAAVEQSQATGEAAPEAVKAAEPANWASAGESPWEMEAKKASMLAATWDAPSSAPSSSVTEAEQFLREEPVAAAPETPSEVMSEFVEQTAFHGASEFSSGSNAQTTETPAHEQVTAQNSGPAGELPSLDFSSPEATTESAYSAIEPAPVNETQEIPTYHESGSNYVAAPLTEEVETPAAGHEAERIAGVTEHVVQANASNASGSQAREEQPDMDALVARVLSKMSPDVLQKVTQEILKPVIAALIKEELDSKK